MTHPIEHIDDESFEREVLASDQPYLLVFSAPWCAPCRAMAPMLERLSSERQGQLRVGKVDSDASPSIAARLGVRGVPTLIVFRGGREAARRLGFAGERALLELIG